MLPHSLSFGHKETTSPQPIFSTLKQSNNKRSYQTSYSLQETIAFKSGGRSPLQGEDPASGRKSVSDGVRFDVQLSSPIVGFSLKGSQTSKNGAKGGDQLQGNSTSLLSEQLGANRQEGLRQLERSSAWTTIRTLEPEEKLLWYNTQLQYPVFSTPLAKEAFSVAARAFRKHKRLSGEPVLSHAVETAKTLAGLGCNQKMVAVALLHDVLDDTEMTESMLAEFVSRDIVDKVLDVSKLSALSQLHRNAGQHVPPTDAAKVSNLYIAMADVEAVIVKLADRLHNMKTLHALPIFKRLRFSRETLDVFVPIANRLGIWSVKSQLEDLCFEQLHPEEFRRIRGLQNQEISRGDIERCLETLQSRLAEKKIQVEDLYGRTKSLYSVFSKLQKKSKGNILLNEIDSVQQRLYDLRAIRIIVRNKQECYQVARQVERLWQPVTGRYKDYIRNPKENGYQSVHLVVTGSDGTPIEVQIRTAKMHYLAEYGVAAHWSYKEENDQTIQTEQEAVVIRYKRWMTQKLKLYDMKCRPYNDTTFEHSFDSLGLDCDAVACGPASVGGSADAFTRYMQQHNLLPADRVERENSPVTVVCSTRLEDNSMGVAYKTCPPKSTARQLLDRYSTSEMCGFELFINNKPINNFDQELQNGDVVELRGKQQQLQQVAGGLESDCSWDSSSSSGVPNKLNLDVQLVDMWRGITQGQKEREQFSLQTSCC